MKQTTAELRGFSCRRIGQCALEAMPPFRRCRFCGRFRLRLIADSTVPRTYFLCRHCGRTDHRPENMYVLGGREYMHAYMNWHNPTRAMMPKDQFDRQHIFLARMTGKLEAPK